MNELVNIKKVSAAYGDELILRDVDLSIRENDFIGIIGPNGGGKTTLLKIIIGLLDPVKGNIEYCNGVKGRTGIGYLSQKNQFDSKFPISVLEVILSGLMGKYRLFGRFNKKDKDKALDLLKSVGLLEYSKRQIGTLSGGQLQKVFLCRALVSDPHLLILDEPNTYVDNKFEGELYEYLKQLNEKIAIVMVSHDIGTISSYIKTIACVNRKLHYHNSNHISEKQLESYNCPIQLLTHGDVPHTVLKKH